MTEQQCDEIIIQRVNLRTARYGTPDFEKKYVRRRCTKPAAMGTTKCGQHHPANVARRIKLASERWKAKQEQAEKSEEQPCG